jgi:hypothetical protein
MNDHEILKRIGLSDHDATDLVKKQQHFLDSLNPAQAEAIRRSLPSWEDAADAMGDDCSVDDLNRFVTKRGHAPSKNAALSQPMPCDETE